MAEIIATIEIAIEHKAAPTGTVKANLTLDGKNSYAVTILKPDGSKEKTAIQADSDEPATSWLIQKLKSLIDHFDPKTITVKVVSDTLNLLPKITYRCSNPQCGAKLFESWGKATGIRIVCRKCKTLGVPIPEIGDFA